MAQIVTTIKKFIGTAAERAAMTEAARNASNPGSTFLESDTGRLYVLDAGTPHTWREKLTNVAGDVQLTGSTVDLNTNIVGSNIMVPVDIQGNALDRRGLLTNRPDATAVDAGVTWWAVDRLGQTDEITVSNGTTWLEV